MEVHHYDYYAVANALHRAADELTGARRALAASSDISKVARSSAKLAAGLQRSNRIGAAA
jgi:hypothetical protein